MKKIAMVIAQDKFRDEELSEPRIVFEKAGFQVSVVSTTTGTAKGMFGMTVTPDVQFRDVKPEDFDALVFVGGVGASQYWDDPLAHKMLWDFSSAGKLIAAICVSPVTMAKAGLLKGKKATVWASDSGQLLVCGARYTGNPVERDGNIITGAGPFAAKEFGEAIVKALA
ncbi:MAG: DJ-1/PfpI family protein [Candidatus Omnitrophica bacterium]|nr:DJ-1/PfpI family protein [Candidatus Omnitrophota bacterium]